MQNAIFHSFIWLISTYSKFYCKNTTQLSDKKSIIIVLIMDGVRSVAITHKITPTHYRFQKNDYLFSVESIREILNKNNLVKVEIAK